MASVNIDINTLFVFFLLVLSNFVGTTLACDLQKLLTNNVLTKHVLAMMLLFFSVQLASNAEEPPAPHTMFFTTIALYAIFVMISRSDFHINVVIMLVIATYAILETYKKHYSVVKKDEAVVQKLDVAQSIAKISIFVLIPIGVVLYYVKRRHEYSQSWSWFKYLFGTNRCKFNG